MLLSALAFMPATFAENTAVNAGFELDDDADDYPDNWLEWGATLSTSGDGFTVYRVNDGSAYSGEDCMQVTGAEYAFSFQDFETFTIGQDYTVAAYFKDLQVGGSTSLVQLQVEYRSAPRGGGDRHLTQLATDKRPCGPHRASRAAADAKR